MNTETHKNELQELFKGENLDIIQSRSILNEVKVNIKRELSRLEIGHCFSLGMTKIKRSGEGLTITFDLSKASVNAIYIP
jgi:hypothetical protein